MKTKRQGDTKNVRYVLLSMPADSWKQRMCEGWCVRKAAGGEARRQKARHPLAAGAGTKPPQPQRQTAHGGKAALWHINVTVERRGSLHARAGKI